jgi:hypothetical protein
MFPLQGRSGGTAVPGPADVVPSRSVTLRATAVLGAFDSEHRRLTLSQLSRRSELPLATVYRLTADLVEGRLLVRRGDGRYEVGARDLRDVGDLADLLAFNWSRPSA